MKAWLTRKRRGRSLAPFGRGSALWSSGTTPHSPRLLDGTTSAFVRLHRQRFLLLRAELCSIVLPSLVVSQTADNTMISKSPTYVFGVIRASLRYLLL